MRIDRAEARARIVGVEEGAGTVVDRLAGHRHVVGVHHSVDEADQQPARHELGLAGHNAVEQRSVGMFRGGCLGIVPGESMIGERPHRLRVAPGGEVLEGANPDVASRHASEHRPGQPGLAHDQLAGGNRRQRPCGGDAERGHGLAHEILAQHRPKRRPAVATAGERGRARALELDVAALPVTVDDLAEQNGAPVAELRHEVAELVPGVSRRDRLGAFRDAVPREHPHPSGSGEPIRVHAEVRRQRVVQADQARGCDRCRGAADEEAVR